MKAIYIFDIVIFVVIAVGVFVALAHRGRDRASGQMTPERREELEENPETGPDFKITPGINPTGPSGGSVG